jgi:MFS family permease
MEGEREPASSSSDPRVPVTPTIATTHAPDPPGSTHRFALTRSTILIGVVSFLSDVSTEMAYPILPIFIKDVLKAPTAALGLIEGIANGCASIVTAFSGWISDRLGRRKGVAFAGYALTAASKPFIASARVWEVVLGARLADRFGKGVRSAPKDALIADTAAAGNLGRAYGFERAMDYSGAVAGPLIGLGLFLALGVDRMRSIFLLSAIPATAAALLILTLRERRPSAARPVASLRLSLSRTTRTYRLFLLASGVFGLANSANVFLILRSRTLGLTDSWTIVAYTLYNAVAAIASLPAGVASDRFSRRNVLIVGYLIYAASYLGFGAADRAWLVWPLFTLYGLFSALTDGVGKSLAVDTSSAAARAAAIGVYSTVIGLTQIAASYIGGVLWDRVSPSATFYFGAALSAAASLLLLLLPRTSRS